MSLVLEKKFFWTVSTGRPVDFRGTSNRNTTGRPGEIFIAFLDEIGNSKTVEVHFQNSSGRPVESYWTSNRNSTGCRLDQMIWANIFSLMNVLSVNKEHLVEHKLLISKECHLILIYIMHSLCTYLSEANNENHLYSKKGAVHCFVIVELI